MWHDVFHVLFDVSHEEKIQPDYPQLVRLVPGGHFLRDSFLHLA